MKKLTYVAFLLLLCMAQSAWGFRLSQRWTVTATDGGGLQLGDPTTLTWGLVPDGTNVSGGFGGSNLISTLDSWYGAGPGGADLTQRPWFNWFAQSFDRWSQLSGLSYVYEPNDDGVTQGGTTPGILGVRPDTRIAGVFIDGPSGTLAFNDFPSSGGDMTIDTGDDFFQNTSQNNRRLRNVVMHEHGHGVGMAHVESNNANFLMEPFINLGFDGLQIDDLLGAHRGYGDFNEKSNGGLGNDVAANATDLGVIAPGGAAAVGTAVSNTFSFVSASATDFVSIDDNGDVDFYSFTINQGAMVDITLEPRGPTYNEGPQGGGQSSFVTSQLSNLSLALYDSDGTTLLASDNSGGLGQMDVISGYSLNTPGQYFVQVTGAANNVQLYRLDVAVGGAPIAPGDFDGNGAFECADVDSLIAAIVSGGNDPAFDLTGEGVVNAGDLDEWLALAGAANLASGNPYLPGDATLDGNVNGGDFVIWNANKFTGATGWCAGDFNASGTIDGQDFVIWNGTKFMSSDAFSAVPEPATAVSLLLGLALLGSFRRR